MNCSDCFHWDKQTDESGRCTGKIPNVNLVQGQGLDGKPVMHALTYWPETRPIDRCGEWKSQEPSSTLQSGLKLS